ncbi:MAG: LruC domain-containing protein [Bacteroidales bacterium]|nr:LruC domain-containing protein [Bacteroidales bacterium]
MKFLKVIAILLLFAIFNSCLKEPENTETEEPAQTMQNLVIPDNFNWETDKLVNLNVSVETLKAYDPKHRISVLTGNPSEGGNLVAAGSAGGGDVFEIILGVPSHISIIYLYCEGPYGSIQLAEVPVTSGLIEYTFGGSKGSTNPGENGFLFKTFNSGPNCEDGCDEYISGGGTIYINGGKTYCISDSFDGNITFESWNGGGTLRVCGTAIINNNTLGLAQDCHIVIAEGGSLEAETIDMGNNSTFTAYESTIVNINKFNAWSEDTYIINHGNLTASKDSYFKGGIENHGTMVYMKKFDLNGNTFINTGTVTVTKKFTTSSSGNVITNNGSLTINDNCEFNNNTVFVNNNIFYVHKDLKLNNDVSFTNNETVTINDDLQCNNNTVLINNCQMTILDDSEFNSDSQIIFNSAYFKTGDNFNIYTLMNINLYEGSMVVCNDVDCGGNIIGFDNQNSIMVYGDFDIWGSNYVDGNIEVAISSGSINGNNANFVNGAYYTTFENATNYLPITACNPDGFGTPSIVDTDNDGIPDELDDYPTDPERAFNIYFPSEDGQVTVAFEDLWPSMGDYDFNDLVVAVYGKNVTNANDEMVDIYMNFIVKAVGASNNNGFGFQLDNITPDMIESVSGMVLEQGYVSLNANGTEANQSKAVVIVTESAEDVITRTEGSMFNTIVENPTGSSDTTVIIIHFVSPVNPSLVNSDSYNPFVIKGQDRTVEIHLANHMPTDLMDESLLGTGDDVSDPVTGVFYITESNLPWGMMIMDEFDYPVEKSQIIDAYNFFGSWAESGGSIYSDWYLNISGYRNTSEIYPANN